jgi:branched-chain amino acid transport system substrate-binding protein
MKRMGKKVVVCGLFYLLLILPFGVYGAETGKIVNIGVAIDLTGPLSAGIKWVLTAVQDYFKTVNDAGGIDGVKVNVLWADTAYNLPKALTAYKKFKEDGVIVYVLESTTEEQALSKQFATDQIVAFGGSMKPWYDDPQSWLYVPVGSYEQNYPAILDYIKKNHKGSGAPKVGFIAYDIPAAKGVLKVMPAYGKSIGVDVKVETAPLNPVDLTPQIMRFKTFGADYIIAFMMSGDPPLILKTAAELNYPAKVITYNERTTIKLAGKLANNMLMFGYNADWDENAPGIKKIKEIQKKYHNQIFENDGYLRGWMKALVINQALAVALKDVGYSKISGAAVRAAIQKIKNLDTGGLTPPLNYSDNSHIGSTYLKFYQVKDGTPVPIGDWWPSPKLDDILKFM